MEHKFASDCHTHSNCSFDGRDSMEALCERAMELGLRYYTATDHCECNKYEEALGHESGYCQVARRAWAEMENCARRFPDLRFLKGIELGQPLQDLSAAEDAVAGRDYDFILGSLHNVAGEEDFYTLGHSGAEKARVESLVSKYYREMWEMTEWGSFDSLAHITYPLRYFPADGYRPDISLHRQEIEEVLKSLIRKEKALEMNTSRLGKPDGPQLPDLEIFTRYRELGGRLVTLGSDAHCAKDLAQGIDLGMELLRKAGFSEYAVFVKREPVLLPLE